MQDENHLKFLPFTPIVETAFWHRFADEKLNELRLSTEPLNIYGKYFNNTCEGISPMFNVDTDSFSGQNFRGSTQGVLINFNSTEDFKQADKLKIIRDQGEVIWRCIRDGSALNNSSILNRFILLLFADLKKHDFLYWFAFPALKFPHSVKHNAPATTLEASLSVNEVEALKSAYDESSECGELFFVVHLPVDATGARILPLSSIAANPAVDNVLLAFCDPSSDDNLPGWPLRNLLALYYHIWGPQYPRVRVIGWRDLSRNGVRSIGRSLLLDLSLSAATTTTVATTVATTATVAGCVSSPDVTGWQRNERGVPGPRVVNMAKCMDPSQIAGRAVDLNLKLMRWRLAPTLDLHQLYRLKCLLVGAGTLGCNVARLLLGWGVRHITFVDSGRVSYSNPARQSLFTFDDAVHKRHKATAAANRLAEICPSVCSEGAVLTVPMPGHPVSQSTVADTLSHVRRLRQLIIDNDVIFLLLDSREGRWLPTLMAAAHGKMVINAALGFDSYLVMRHGVHVDRCDAQWRTVDKSDASGAGVRLGCYFCNDVVVPANSSVGRSLDQQCSVTRPGVSNMAAALAVEMAVSLLQHPLRCFAAAAAMCDGDQDQTVSGVLGSVPHSIRGSLGGLHQQMCPWTPAFQQCTACSHQIVELYSSDESEAFLLRVFNDPSYLERVSGLSELHQLADNVQMIELEDELIEDCSD